MAKRGTRERPRKEKFGGTRDDVKRKEVISDAGQVMTPLEVPFVKDAKYIKRSSDKFDTSYDLVSHLHHSIYAIDS